MGCGGVRIQTGTHTGNQGHTQWPELRHHSMTPFVILLFICLVSFCLLERQRERGKRESSCWYFLVCSPNAQEPLSLGLPCACCMAGLQVLEYSHCFLPEQAMRTEPGSAPRSSTVSCGHHQPCPSCGLELLVLLLLNCFQTSAADPEVTEPQRI